MRCGGMVGAALVGALLATAVAAAGPQALTPAATPADGSEVVPHLRHADSIAAGLLAEGRRRSATFRALADAVQAADVLVFVETSPRLRGAGSTVFVGHAGATRILRVRVATPGCLNALVATLGHELRHVVEIAEAGDVQGEESMAAHYERTGLRLPPQSQDVRRYETVAALLVEGRILDELRHRAPKVARR